MSERWLTAAELGKARGVSGRTIRNWAKKDGFPAAREIDKGNGKTARVWDAKAVAAWCDGEAPQVTRKAGAAATNTTPVAIRSERAREPAAAGTSMRNPQELEDLLERLHKAERATFSRWVKLQNDPDAKASLVTAARRDWQETVKQVRELERDITGILQERGEFVPAAEVSQVVGKAMAATVAALDRLGVVCGSRLENLVAGSEKELSALDFRAEIERETEKMKEMLRAELVAMTNDEMPNDEGGG